jgi:hypothetical protein
LYKLINNWLLYDLQHTSNTARSRLQFLNQALWNTFGDAVLARMREAYRAYS